MARGNAVAVISDVVTVGLEVSMFHDSMRIGLGLYPDMSNGI